MDYFLEEKDKDGNFDYRARSSVAWDYEGCMYYLKPFREKFAEDRWNTYWILKYQNWNTAESEADPPMSCINERAIRYADVLLLLAESYLRGKQDLPMAIGYLNQIRERAIAEHRRMRLSLMIWSVSVPSSSLWKGNVFTIFAVGDCWKSVCRLVMKFGINN